MFVPTDEEILEEIEEQLRQLDLPNGDEEIEFDDTQYSDYDGGVEEESD